METFTELLVPLEDISFERVTQDPAPSTMWVNHSELFWVLKSHDKWVWELYEDDFQEVCQINPKDIVKLLESSLDSDQKTHPILFDTLKEAKQDILKRVKSILTAEQYKKISPSFYHTADFQLLVDGKAAGIRIIGKTGHWGFRIVNKNYSEPLYNLLPEETLSKVHISKPKAVAELYKVLGTHLNVIYVASQKNNHKLHYHNSVHHQYYDNYNWYKPFIDPEVDLQQIFA